MGFQHIFVECVSLLSHLMSTCETVRD